MFSHNNIEASTTPHWKLLGTIIWGALIFLLFIVTQAFSIGLWFGLQAKTPQINDFSNITNGNELSLIVILSSLVCSLVTLGIIKIKKNAIIKSYLCINSVYFKSTLKWLVLMILFLALGEVIAYFIKDQTATNFMTGIYKTASPPWRLWIAVVLVGPLFEELFFRGFLLKGFSHSFLGVYGAVVVTSAFWAIIHIQYSAYYISVIFCLGLIFGLAKIKTKSILTPLILHMANNAFALMMAAYQV
jgi:uncharacterized protein